MESLNTEEKVFCRACGSLMGIDCGDAEPDYNNEFCSEGCFSHFKKLFNNIPEALNAEEIGKMGLIIDAITVGGFPSEDYNGQESGFFIGPNFGAIVHNAWQPISLGAAPHTIRACADGTIRAMVRKEKKEGGPTALFSIVVYDELGERSDDGNGEWLQRSNVSGLYSLKLSTIGASDLTQFHPFGCFFKIWENREGGDYQWDEFLKVDP